MSVCRPVGIARRVGWLSIGVFSFGERGFKALARVTELARVPWVLEVPGINDSGPRREEIERLRAVVRAVEPRPLASAERVATNAGRARADRRERTG
ncbi:MAG: hypothetical protein ABR525_09695 [Candidatus Limnocylindria bacterium]